ncbi:acyl-CoA dehydrogenase family protein [Paenibacillus allorhizosphaerae]|uniref:Acryloyl-CoA reductase (NADH) n=1 Tax=Paenibacillus allorhizosphaerae TaxID=2849866 RepID=A0ABM8VV17_9BACL|nr:acyl-CoA dehydrogenase family protein [Paenibacillus allorhizosphaerae]CAG7659186.1 Acryloyl-CoA reductase (NADH) [Paenibacillus allorhizosphaerae]
MSLPDVTKTSYDDNLREITNTLLNRAGNYDQSGLFPHDNFDLIVQHGLNKITIPEEYGGWGFGFEKTSEAIITLASGCPSTALCLSMHYYTVAGLSKLLSKEQKQSLFKNIIEKGQFVTSFNQPNVSIVHANQDLSNSTEITITKVNGGYTVNGLKKYVSGITRFNYLPIFGNQIGIEKSRYGVTAMLALIDDPGVRIKESWDFSALKSTLSHDVIFEDVFISNDRLIGREGFGIEDTPSLVYWSRLAISSVYLGIAKAALDYITKVIKEKKDKISRKTIAFLPGTQFALSDIKIKYDAAESQLMMFAKQADQETIAGRYTDQLFQKALMTKYFVSHSCNEIVWQAMQIEGMNSLFKGNQLERLYRDVRAATFHQPNDDLIKEILAKKALGLIVPKNRWL